MSNPYPDYKRNTITLPVAEQPAQPQEPVACLSETQAKAILDLALDLEKTGRLVAITDGQERTDFVARNRSIQCALEDALRNAIAPPAQRKPLSDEKAKGISAEAAMWGEVWEKDFIQAAIALIRKTEAAHGIKENT